MTHTEWSRGKQKTKGIPGSGAAVINAQAEAIATYIYDHVGYNAVQEKLVDVFLTRFLMIGVGSR